MNNFRKPHGNGGREGGRFSNHGPARPSFEQRPARTRFGGPRPEGVELFDAICAKCGNACQVPFRPNGQKPVYCRACFGNPQNAAGKENFIRRDASAKPFEPREPRPENRELVDLKQQMNAMQAKIDSILRIVETMSRPVVSAPVAALPIKQKAEAPKAVEKDVAKKKTEKKKVVAKKKK
jgi:CxxC-x17-CxxC domain-containing protein